MLPNRVEADTEYCADYLEVTGEPHNGLWAELDSESEEDMPLGPMVAEAILAAKQAGSCKVNTIA